MKIKNVYIIHTQKKKNKSKVNDKSPRKIFAVLIIDKLLSEIKGSKDQNPIKVVKRYEHILQYCIRRKRL
jgi:hypothetical protein